MTMLAVRTHAAGAPLRFEQVPAPRPIGTQVRVRVAGCGVCHTDLHIASSDRLRVSRPVTLGHEIGGWLDAAGPDAERPLRRARIRAGDPVLVFGGWGCGACHHCVTGDEQRCERGEAPGFQRDGGYATHVLVPHPGHLVALHEFDPAEAAPLADAGVTAYRATQRAGAWLTDGARVLLIGLGGLGQFAIQFLRRRRDLTIAVRELNPDKLLRAEELGADLGSLEGDETLVAAGLGGPATVVFDFVGTDATLDYAARNVAAGGLVSLVGEAGGSFPFGFDRMPVEASMTTTAWGSAADLREVVRLARRGRIRWQVERLPLHQAQEAHARLAAGRVAGRLVLVPEESAGATRRTAGRRAPSASPVRGRTTGR